MFWLHSSCSFQLWILYVQKCYESEVQRNEVIRMSQYSFSLQPFLNVFSKQQNCQPNTKQITSALNSKLYLIIIAFQEVLIQAPEYTKYNILYIAPHSHSSNSNIVVCAAEPRKWVKLRVIYKHTLIVACTSKIIGKKYLHQHCYMYNIMTLEGRGRNMIGNGIYSWRKWVVVWAAT